jgi:hypothetical protein
MIGTGDSASRIHLLTDGQSSSLMPNPISTANSNANHRRGITDENDDQTLGMIHLPAPEENDPVMLALSEMGLAEQPLRPMPSIVRTQASPPESSDHEAETQMSGTVSQQYDEWYGNVPVWFWCLFGLFVISTIFLAGILVALTFGGSS